MLYLQLILKFLFILQFICQNENFQSQNAHYSRYYYNKKCVVGGYPLNDYMFISDNMLIRDSRVHNYLTGLAQIQLQ